MAPLPPQSGGVVVDYGTHEIEFPDEESARKYASQFAKQPVSNSVSPIQTSKPEIPQTPQIPASVKSEKGPSFGQTLKSGLLNSLGPLGWSVDNAKTVSEQPIYRNFTRSATAGLSEPIAAGTSALVSKGMQEVGLMDGNKTIGQFYDRAMERQRGALNKMDEESPVQSFVGNVAGVAAPGGAFNRLYGGSSKIAGKVLPQVGNLAKYGRYAIQGGLSNMGYGAMNEASKKLGGEEAHFTPGQDALTGAAFDVGGRLLSSGIGKTGEVIRDSISNSKIPSAIRGLPGMGLFKNLRELKVKNAEKAFAENVENAKSLYKSGRESALSAADQLGGPSSPANVGQSLQNSVKETSDKVFSNYKKLVDPIIEKNGDAKISPEIIRRKIAETLKKFGVEGGSHDAWRERIKQGIFAEDDQIKALNKLIDYSELISKNPTLSELKRLEGAINVGANFDAREPTHGNKIFRDVWHSARDNTIDAVRSLVGDAKAKGVDAARRTFHEKTSSLENLDGLSRLYPQDVPGSKLLANPKNIETVTKNPEVKKALQETILKDLSLNASTPKKFTQAIEKYGREYLGSLLGKENFDRVLTTEKNLSESFRPLIKPKMQPVPENGFYRGIQKLLTPGKGSAGYQKYIAPFIGSRSIPAIIQPKVGDSI